MRSKDAHTQLARTSLKDLSCPLPFSMPTVLYCTVLYDEEKFYCIATGCVTGSEF